MLKQTVEQLNNLVAKSRSFLLVTDLRPDGDTYGSSLAFADYLRSIDKKVVHFAPNETPDALKFLPGVELITVDDQVFLDETIDVFMIFDSSRRHVIEGYLNKMPRRPKLVIFDHHSSNEGFADVNMIDTNASSTCEIVYDYFQSECIDVTRDMAKCLMTGLLTDTGMLNHPPAVSSTFARAGELMAAGGNMRSVLSNISRNMPLNRLNLWGRILERTQVFPQQNVAVTWVTQKDLRETGTTKEDYAEMSDYLGSTLDVEVTMFLKQSPDGREVRVSMRSHGRAMLPLAQFFGGGGHKKACAFSVQGRVEQRQGKIAIIL